MDARQEEELRRLSEEHLRVTAHLNDLQGSLLDAKLQETHRLNQACPMTCLMLLLSELSALMRGTHTMADTHGGRRAGTVQPCTPAQTRRPPTCSRPAPQRVY